MSVGLCLRLNVNIFLSYYIVLNIFTPYHFAFLQTACLIRLHVSDGRMLTAKITYLN